MKNFKASILILCSLCICNIINANTDNSVYVAYLGEKKHDDHQLTVDSHHDLLATVVGSKEQASKLMIHNYKYGFSGFSARLTKDQARRLSELPGVVRVFEDQVYKPQGNSLVASEYFGLTSPLPDNIGKRTRQGEDVIIGVIDTGIWANHSAGIFSDEGYGPIPARWKGTCKDGNGFLASQHCNKKVIGAYWFRRGATEAGFLANDTVEYEINSPLDFQGHGSHCASTVAGSVVNNVTLLNNNYGNFRGVAPKARLAIYKACYNIKKGAPKTDDCLTSDVYAAFDQAILDGVDVISASIGPQHAVGDDFDNYLNFASLHATLAGITVVAAAGNMGPSYKTMGNTSPWHITVAAARVNAEIAAPITLGNGVTVSSVPLSGVEALGTRKVVTIKNSVLQGWNVPSDNQTLTDMIKDNFVFLPEYSGRHGDYMRETPDARNVFNSAKRLGAAGMIISVASTNTITYMFQTYTEAIYCVDEAATKQIMAYLATAPQDNSVTIGKPVIREGPEVRTLIESYSSRGPSLHTPEILKPDITAPAWGLLGAESGVQHGQAVQGNGFKTMKGTSSATPVVAGLVALIKAERPEWSPAAIKSALVTTASRLDKYGAPILSQWSKTGLAGPFDMGGGIANVQAATNPGLIYDMQPIDYTNYLCAEHGISKLEHMRHITYDTGFNCPAVKTPVMDMNLPSIGVILGNMTKVEITRTATNVGPVTSTYIPIIDAPRGTTISVRPKKMSFFQGRSQMKYYLTIEKTQGFENNTAGTITWTDKVHQVTSPIVVLY